MPPRQSCPLNPRHEKVLRNGPRSGTGTFPGSPRGTDGGEGPGHHWNHGFGGIREAGGEAAQSHGRYGYGILQYLGLQFVAIVLLSELSLLLRNVSLRDKQISISCTLRIGLAAICQGISALEAGPKSLNIFLHIF